MIRKPLHADYGTLLPIYLAPDDGAPPAGAPSSRSSADLSAMSWEERVERLESLLADSHKALDLERAARVALESQLTSERASVRAEKVRASVDALRDYAVNQKQVPLEETHLAAYAELLGNPATEKAAAIMGQLLRDKADSLSSGSFQRVRGTEGAVVTLGQTSHPVGGTDREPTYAEKAKRLRAIGYTDDRVEKALGKPPALNGAAN